MMVLGITGGIGSGKSNIAKIFKSLGWSLFNADNVAKEILESHEIRPSISDLFGEEIIIDGKVDRAGIAKQVFSNEKKLESLNAIIHPRVFDAFEKFKADSFNELIIKEAAILFETGSYTQNDCNLLVTSPESLRIERVMKRDNVSRADVEARVAKQWPDEKKIPLADFVIENDSNKSLILQVIKIHENLSKN